MPVRIRKASPLRKALYPLMAVAMVAPIFASASTPLKASADTNEPSITIIFAGYQQNKPKQQKSQGYGRYVMKSTRVDPKNIPKRNRGMILKDWNASRKNKNQLRRNVRHANHKLRHRKRAPRNTQYIVPNHNSMMIGSTSSKAGANKKDHNGLAPVKIKSRTTLWDIARANMKHVNRHTTRKTVNRSARVLLKLNHHSIKSIHQTLKKGTKLLVPSNQAKTLKTKFTPWMEFTAGLSKAAIRDKRLIADAESNGRYHIWAGGTHSGNGGRPYGKYQLDASYLHLGKRNADNGHAWDSPYTQEDIANKYVFGRYHSWQNAMRFRRIHHWY